MFDTTSGNTDTLTTAARVEAWEQELVGLETEITQLPATVCSSSSASWTVTRWMQGRGCAPWATGYRPTSTCPPRPPTGCGSWPGPGNDALDTLMAQGRCGLDRVALLAKPHAANVDDHQLGDATATRFSLGRLYGLLERVRSFTQDEERNTFEHRYLVYQLQPRRIRLQTVGTPPRRRRSDRRKGAAPTGNRTAALPGQSHGQGQRRADALTSICLDSLTADTATGSGEATRPGGDGLRSVHRRFLGRRHRWGVRGVPGFRGQVGPDMFSEILCGEKCGRSLPTGSAPSPIPIGRRHTPGDPQVRPVAGHGAMFHRRLPQPIPAPNPPHPRKTKRRQPRPRTTWSACAGTTTTSPSTNSATPSTPSHPSTDDGCSPPASPPARPFATDTGTWPPSPAPRSRARAQSTDPGSRP